MVSTLGSLTCCRYGANELSGSLKDYGIICEVLNLLSDGRVDTEGLAAAVRGAKMAYIQRSRGYSLRPSLSIKEIERLCTILRQIQPDIVIMVDNCYGEFVETREPTAVGADLMAGSLIKNRRWRPPAAT